MNTTVRADPFRAAFDGRDPAPAAAVLRQLALAALADALNFEPAAPPPTLAPLADWLGEVPLQGAAVDRSLRQLQGAFLFGQIRETAAVSRAIVAGALPAGRLGALRDRVARLRRGKPVVVAPPGFAVFGPALAALAFTEPAFRRSVIAMIRDDLGSRVVFHRDNAPIPILSAACCLNLIAARISITDQTPVSLGMRQLAEDLALGVGWAEFWDQWVLREAAVNGVFSLPPAIKTLPILAHGFVAIAQAAEENDPRVDPGWRNRIPGYCQQLFLGLP